MGAGIVIGVLVVVVAVEGFYILAHEAQIAKLRNRLAAPRVPQSAPEPPAEPVVVVDD
jgi:hypothetical protein